MRIGSIYGIHSREVLGILVGQELEKDGKIPTEHAKRNLWRPRNYERAMKLHNLDLLLDLHSLKSAPYGYRECASPIFDLRDYNLKSFLRDEQFIDLVKKMGRVTFNSKHGEIPFSDERFEGFYEYRKPCFFFEEVIWDEKPKMENWGWIPYPEKSWRYLIQKGLLSKIIVIEYALNYGDTPNERIVDDFKQRTYWFCDWLKDNYSRLFERLMMT